MFYENEIIVAQLQDNVIQTKEAQARLSHLRVFFFNNIY